jgi:phage FluMu gp28-like protein
VTEARKRQPQKIAKGPAAEQARCGARAKTFSPKSLLLPYQRRWVDDASRFKIGCMSRQTGKSFGTAGEAVEDALKDPGTKWVCMSAGERQALEWMEQARMWAEAYRLPIEGYAEDRQFAQALMKSAEICFANGSRIIAIPANPSTARGYSANVILDEFAYHEDPDKIWAAMFPSQTNPLAGTFLQRVQAALVGESTNIVRNLKLRVVSTFNGKGNKFFDLWEHAEANGYTKHLVTIEDAVRDGLPIDIAKLKLGFADSDAWEQEFMCVASDADRKSVV